MGKINSSEPLISGQVETQVLLQSQYVAGQRRSLFLLVCLVGHPEQESDTSDKQHKRHSWQDPKPAPAAGTFWWADLRAKAHGAILARP